MHQGQVARLLKHSNTQPSALFRHAAEFINKKGASACSFHVNLKFFLGMTQRTFIRQGDRGNT